MRHVLSITAALAALALSGGSLSSSDAIVRLLNSRTAGSRVEYAEAARRVRKDADAGQPLQRFVLAVLSTDKDAPDAMKLTDEERREYLESSREKILQLAEERNNPIAWYVLSLETNDIGMLRRAASGGNVQALNALGTYLLTEAMKRGEKDGKKLDPAAFARVSKGAFKCFRWAANQGDENGRFNLAVCFLNGYGCDKDPQAAFENFRLAAEAGHVQAMQDLARCYDRGIGVKEDTSKAMYWHMRLKAALGDRSAKDWLEEVKK